jgi:hypothetical protein
MTINMKKYIIPALVLAALSLASCSQDKLEIVQQGVITNDSFYNGSDESAESALNAAYDQAMRGIIRNDCYISSPYHMVFNYPGDDLYAAGSFYGDNDNFGQLNEFRYDVTNDQITGMYKGFYKAIYGCNLVTDHFKYGTSTTQDRCISEARVLRAFCHMMLAIGWDNPPKIDHVISGSDHPANCPHNELLEWCAKECEESAQYLDERKSTSDKAGAYIVTKGVAYAFAGKARMFLGDYSGAKTDLKKVIDSKKYELVPSSRLRESFHKAGDGNEEKVFEFNIAWDTSISTWSGAIQKTVWMEAQLWGWRSDHMAGWPAPLSNIGGWGGLGVSKSFAEALIANDGMDSYRRKAWFLTYDEVLYDPTFTYPSDETCKTLEEKQKDPKRGVSDPSGLYGNPGYFQWKWSRETDDMAPDNSYLETNFEIMRYAEVLLLYAEACARTNDSDGLQYLNAIQQRAGSKHISTACTLDEVKNEKRFEMWLEQCRWPDLVRWGEASKCAANGDEVPSLKDHFFDSADSGTKTATHQGYVTWAEPNKDKVHGFKAGKHEYYPYPYSETSINPEIVQNPGW